MFGILASSLMEKEAIALLDSKGEKGMNVLGQG